MTLARWHIFGGYKYDSPEQYRARIEDGSGVNFIVENRKLMMISMVVPIINLVNIFRYCFPLTTV